MPPREPGEPRNAEFRPSSGRRYDDSVDHGDEDVDGDETQHSEELRYRADYRRSANVVYVLGDGSGSTRNVTEVEDTQSQTDHFRRESSVDARFATTVAQRTDIGNAELGRLDALAVALRGRPLRASSSCRYHDDWDVGYDLTVAIPELGVDATRRVVAVTVDLTQGALEDVRFELGYHAADSVFHRIDERLLSYAAAANE